MNMERGSRPRHLVTLSPSHLVIGTVAFLMIAGFGAYAWYARRGPEPPGIALQGIDPAVAAAVEDARAAVRRSPRSADAWGTLGMTLQAHQFLAEAEVCF